MWRLRICPWSQAAFISPSTLRGQLGVGVCVQRRHGTAGQVGGRPGSPSARLPLTRDPPSLGAMVTGAGLSGRCCPSGPEPPSCCGKSWGAGAGAGTVTARPCPREESPLYRDSYPPQSPAAGPAGLTLASVPPSAGCGAASWLYPAPRAQATPAASPGRACVRSVHETPFSGSAWKTTSTLPGSSLFTGGGNRQRFPPRLCLNCF